jgi:hypothetical protein
MVMAIVLLLAAWLFWGYSILVDRGAMDQVKDPVAAATDAAATTSVVVLLSRNATVTADVRGNLGEAMVLADPNGTDWLRDRWRAASDMHGTEIRGRHWVRLEFAATSNAASPSRIGNGGSGGGSYGGNSSGIITSIILDWETAYSDDYVIHGLLRDDGNEKDRNTINNNSGGGGGEASDKSMIPFYDSRQKKNDATMFFPALVKTRSYGQSPGVKQKLPLHVIHEIEFSMKPPTPVLRGILLTIRSPFHRGWGVSLWSIQVYGMVATTTT